MLMNVTELSQMYRTLGARRTCQMLTESLQRSRAGEIGHLRPSDFSIRALAEALVPDGREWVRSLDPSGATPVLESGSGVDTTAFSNITGQLIINEVMSAYDSPVFEFSRRFRTIQTRLSGERIPGIGKIGDKAESVSEGMPFPNVGFGEDYIDTPATDKKGLIVPVTKEAVFFDRTGMLLERAREVGESLGINKEKRCVDVLIGAVNNYKWKGTTYNTYQTATPWINELSGAGNDLSDWSDIDAAEQLFNDITDPNTGEPVLINPNTIVATPARKHVVNRIINATEVRYTDGSSQTLAANPSSNYQGVTSRYLYSRLKSELSLTASQAQATWFLGDLERAFRYMENWPITVVQAPQNSEAEFTQDIVARFKASERGAAAVWNPRFVARVKGF